MDQECVDIRFDDESYDDILEQSTLLDSDLSSESREEIEREFRPKKRITIVVAGKTGAGKSTLIGSLLPNRLSKVDVKVGPTASACTLEKYEGEIGGSVVNVYDTRGFCSAKTSRKDAKLLEKELRKEFNEDMGQAIDLIIYCQEMFQRFDESSLTSLTLFGNMLPPGSWDVCIVALTKANLLPPPIEDLRADKQPEAMIAVQKQMRKEMREKYFQSRGLLKQIAEIPFVPVGYRTSRRDASKLPCNEDSIEQLAKECISRCSPGSALVIASALSNKKIGLAVGVVGSALVVGGLGAVAGGLLTFYVGGAGAVPAAAIGAAIGAALGGAGAPAAIGCKAATQHMADRILTYAENKGVEEKPQ